MCWTLFLTSPCFVMPSKDDAQYKKQRFMLHKKFAVMLCPRPSHTCRSPAPREGAAAKDLRAAMANHSRELALAVLFLVYAQASLCTGQFATGQLFLPCN